MRWGTPLPPRPVVLTFDDGWRNVLKAVPVLDQYGFKASFWIITDKGIGDDYMVWPDIEKLAAHPGFEVYAHTASHPWHKADNLVTWVESPTAHKGEAQARAELVDARMTLMQHLHLLQPYLAWPCGWYNERLIQLAQDAGYKALFTAEDGLNKVGGDVLRIKRTFIDGSCTLKDFAQTLQDGRYRVCQTGSPPTQGHLP
jgi:peptidoglycan/xylan/chitin deacetylase (PgdA/CDA1 family)